MEKSDKGLRIVQVEMMLLIFLILFGVLRCLSSKTSVFAASDGGAQETGQDGAENDYIQWVDFNVSDEALSRAYDYDIETYLSDNHVNWIELLAYLAVQYGGDFSQYRVQDMAEAVEKIQSQGIEALTANLKYYDYYREAYEAVLGGMVGVYETEEAGDSFRAETEAPRKTVFGNRSMD